MARNLLLGTGIIIESEGRLTGSKYQPFTDKFVIPKTGLKGKWVTISFDYEVRGAYGSADIGQARIGFSMAVKRASGAYAHHEKWFYPSKDESNPSTEKGRMYLAANLASYTEEELQTFGLGLYIQRIAGGYARVSNLMLVIGDAQDPWQPAPEDVTYNIPQDIELGSLKLTAGEPFQKADDAYRIRSASPVDAYSTDFMMAVPDGYELIVNDYGADGTLIGRSMNWLVPESGYVGRKLTNGTTQIGFIFKRSDNGEISNNDIKIVSGGGTSNMIKTRQAIEVVSPEPIGGRNLAINSGRPGRDMSKPIGLGFDSGKGPSKYLTANFSVSQKIDLNTPYCVTIKLNNKATGRTRIGCFVNGGTYRIGEWQPLAQGEQVISWTGTLNGRMESATGETINFYAGPLDGVNGDLEIEWLKLEKGNQATDWTPAPEDVEQGIADASDALRQYYDSSIVVAKEGITSEVNRTVEEIRDGIGQIETTVSTLRQESDHFTIKFADLQETTNDTKEKTDRRLQKIESSVRIDDKGIALGRSDSNLTVKLSNTELGFYDGEARLAYFSNQALFIEDATINNSVSMGNFAFVPRPDGSVDFKKVKG